MNVLSLSGPRLSPPTAPLAADRAATLPDDAAPRSPAGRGG